MHVRALTLPLALFTAAVLAACGEDPEGRGPFEPQHSHNGKEHGGGGGRGGESVSPWSAADVTGHDVPAASWTLVTSCSGAPGSKDTHPRIVWPRHDQCANLTLQDGTLLSDDPTMEFGMKGGSIVWIQFRQQDVNGSEGIQYESERVAIEPAVRFTGAGMTLHVHATEVPVYRLKGHIGGPRVGVAGTMNIGDVVYK
jgi:hypothetical protein